MKTRIALEVPIDNLDMGFEHSDYIFALAHLWDNQKYREAVLRWKGLGHEIYLDNSAFELKTSVGIEWYLQVIDEMEPDVIVVPDALGDLGKTLRLTKTFYESLSTDHFAKYKFMVVLQGQDNRERLKCFHILKTFGFPIHIYGLPRHAYPHRVELLHSVYKFLARSKTPIHFLGCPDIEELRGIGPLLHSMDTSWVAKQALGKNGFDSLDFQNDFIKSQRMFLMALSRLEDALGGDDE